MKNAKKIDSILLTYKILNAVDGCIIKNDRFESEGIDYIDDGTFMISLDKKEYQLLKSLLNKELSKLYGNIAKKLNN